jgi:hypothetical protein
MIAMRHPVKLLLTIALAACASHAFAADSDVALRRQILGAWQVTNPADWAVKEKLFAMQELGADGTGALLVYKNRFCSKLVQRTPFSWNLKDGVLFENYIWEGKPVHAHAKVLFVDYDTFMQGDGVKEPLHMIRAPSCGAS